MSTLQLLAWLVGTCVGACIGSLAAIPVCKKLTAWQWKKFSEEMQRKYKL